MSHLRRLCALVAVTTLGLTGLTVAGGPAQAATDPRPLSIGASWLDGQLTDGGGFLQGDFGPLYGPSIDAALSLRVAGGHADAVAGVRTALAAAIQNGDYISGEAFGDAGSTYAGAVAKSLVLAEETGGGETSFGAVNLVTRLEAQVSSTAPNTGRLSDTSSFGDFANTLGQAFAARGLSGAPSATGSKASDAISFLLLQQCSAGYFRQAFAGIGDADQSCDAGIASGKSAPSVDATAIATQQLQAISSPSAPVTAAIANATAWLLSQQRGDGSFAADAQLGPNSDSTGLAGTLLAHAGETAAATRAAIWVKTNQADEPGRCPNGLSGQTGAIGYDGDAVAAGRASGIGGAQQWRIATAQALPVLALAPAPSTNLAISGPTGFVKARRTTTFRISGAAPGDKVCVSGFGAARRVVAPGSQAFSVALTAPSRTADRIATASLRSGDAASFVVHVLGAKRLKVVPGRFVKHRGTRLRVVVRGLAPAEHVTLRFRGVIVRTGHANAEGRFVRHIRVGHKLGEARIVARGQFPAIRHGRAIIRVVR